MIVVSQHFRLLQLINERVVMQQHLAMQRARLLEVCIRLEQLVCVLDELVEVLLGVLQVATWVNLTRLQCDDNILFDDI